MPSVTLPFNIQNGDPLDADKVMANEQTITSALNGGLDTSNALTDVPVSQPGNTAAEGVSVSFLRSDATFVIQGVEKLAALPTTSNFIGRMVVRTSDSKLYYCTDATGTGTFIVIGNQAAIDVPIHASQHADGQHDPLPDLVISDHMKGPRTIFQATIAADVNSISTSSFTTIVDLVLPSTVLNTQTLAITVQLTYTNVHATNNPNTVCRVQDVTAGTTIFRSGGIKLGASSGANRDDPAYSFFYPLPASGARTLRVQAGSDLGTVNVLKTTAFNSEAVIPVTIQAVIV